MIDTRLNFPNAETEHGAETRDHRQHGGYNPGDSRIADKASGGTPIYVEYGTRSQEAQEESSPSPSDEETSDEEAIGEGLASGESPDG